ncbi:MAG: CvpA family protein [Lachnospiraceae bacterium]|nr:CvpA family protein [Lachnospiraceae bacterium]
MDYIILIGVVAVIGLFALVGYKKGMVKIVLSMIAMAVTYILAAALTIPVSMALKTATPVYTTIEESVEKMVKEAKIDDTKLDITAIEKLNLPSQIEEKLMDGAEKVTTGFNKYLVSSISNYILKALTFFILFVVIYIVLSIIIKVFDFVSKLPLLNTVNKAGGLAVGAAQGLIIVWIGCLVITAFGDKAWAQEAFRQVNDNKLLTFIYENNPIIFLVTKFM